MKLELKHLAPYLPYGLVVFIPIWKCERTISQLRQKSIVTKDFANYLLFADIKPILRPLSDLTKERIDMIYFGVIATDNDMYGSRTEFEDDLDLWLCDMSHIPLCVYSYLIENHFDVFGLIEKGLAIDINTITK